MESHFDYGTRAGYWRIVRVLDKYDATCTMNGCAEALALSPWLGRDAVARGFEISCHGYRWLSPKRMSEAEERDWIHRAVKTIADACGVRPVGWHTRCPHTPNTRRLLVEEGGFIYDSDAYDDDLPYLLDVGNRQHVVLPYSLDTNDMRFQRPEAGFVRAKDFAEYVIGAFDWRWEEGALIPKMMTVGLHIRTIGRPARIWGLDRVLKHIREKGGTWIARRDEIARHWVPCARSGRRRDGALMPDDGMPRRGDGPFPRGAGDGSRRLRGDQPDQGAKRFEVTASGFRYPMYNLGAGTNVRVREVMDAIRHASPCTGTVSGSAQPGAPRPSASSE